MKKLLLATLLVLVPCSPVLSAIESLRDCAFRATAQSILDNPEKFLERNFRTSNVGELILPADLQEDLVRYLKSHSRAFCAPSLFSFNPMITVCPAALSPDGTKRAIGSSDGTVRVSNALTGEPICVITHGNNVCLAVFSPDGTKLVTASSDGTVRVSNALTGESIYVITHDSSVCLAVFSPDGTKLVTASSDGTVRVSNALTGESICVITHDSLVCLAVFSPDGTRLVTASLDRTARVTHFPLLEITDLKQLIAVLIAHKTGVESITDVRLRQKVVAIITTFTDQQKEALRSLLRNNEAYTDAHSTSCVIL